MVEKGILRLPHLAVYQHRTPIFPHHTVQKPATENKIWKEGREQLDRYLSMQHGCSQYILPINEFHHWPNKEAVDNLITAFEKLGMGAGAKGSQKAPSGGTAPTPSDGTWKDSQCKT